MKMLCLDLLEQRLVVRVLFSVSICLWKTSFNDCSSSQFAALLGLSVFYLGPVLHA